MKQNIASSSKIFDSTTRIQILASLSVCDLKYTELKKICQVADGAMTNHTSKLSNTGYITVKKEFVNNHPQTTYSITDFGREELYNFIKILNDSVKKEK